MVNLLSQSSPQQVADFLTTAAQQLFLEISIKRLLSDAPYLFCLLIFLPLWHICIIEYLSDCCRTRQVLDRNFFCTCIHCTDVFQSSRVFSCTNYMWKQIQITKSKRNQWIPPIFEQGLGKEIIQESHQGFTSCLTNPLAFYNGVTPSLDKRRATDIIYLDFCKALYMVHHNIPCSKLDLMGGLLSGWEVGWMLASRG